MTKHYNVHIYREMRLVFNNIEAESPDKAAAIARDKPTDEASEIDDCNGLDLSALVDEIGDAEYERSVDIDFEAEPTGKAGQLMLNALTAILPYAENESHSIYECWKRDGDPETKERLAACERAIEEARAVIKAAKAAGSRCGYDSLDVHAILAARRQIAAIWSIDDVQTIRPDLTKEQAWEVLQAVDRRHDAAVGINWDVLACHADVLVDNVTGRAS